MTMVDRDTVATWYRDLQERLCAAIEGMDPEARFTSDVWERPGGGGGNTRILSGGDVFEKAAVNWSAVHGATPPALADRMAQGSQTFHATGISLIAHPWNPHAPTVHMNTRFVVTTKPWFGGGADLTPVLDRRRTQDDPDTLAFHGAMRAACEAHAGVADIRIPAFLECERGAQ